MPEVVTWNWVVADDRMWGKHSERIQYVGNANVLKNLVVNVQLKGVLVYCFNVFNLLSFEVSTSSTVCYNKTVVVLNTHV